jgi:hypothetical protein
MIIKRITIFATVCLFITGLSVFFKGSFIIAASEPGYVVSWSPEGPGQFPLKLQSSWFKNYETKDGKVESSTVTLGENNLKSQLSPEDLVFVNIKANSFESNEECSIQLVVKRVSGQSAVTVDAFIGGLEDEGGTPSCSTSLVGAMSKVVEPDGDSTSQGPTRDDDPNTDSEEETQNDIDATADAAADATADAAADETETPNCQNSITDVGWIICPVIDGAFAIMRVVEGAVVGQLKFTLDDIGGDPSTDANTTQKIKQSHGSILLISNYLFAIGILWIVISQAITGGAGGGFFGAYEAKKILPKLIAGIFVANVSWELVNLLLIITNAIGDSIKSIMLAPFEGATNLSINFNNGSDLLLVGVSAGLGIGLAIFGFFAVSPLLIMVLIAILSAIIFSVLRKGMIIVLVIFAPIMLALSPFMPNIFKRYYKLLLNVIVFYIVVMVSIAAFTIIGYIIFQGAGGGNSSATSIGQSLTKLIGIAFYFGWMFPVLAFAKNNFDVVGKVGGSLQSMGNKAGRQFGQNRLQGNERRQGRELRKNWRNQRTKEKALESDMNKLTYKGNNPFKKGRSKFMQGQQVGFIPTRGVKKWQSERDRMMGIAENQVLEESVKKATEEASYKGMSSIPYLPKNNVSITDSEGNVLKDDKGKPLGVSTLGDVYKHLAAGRKISYKGRDGEERVLDGSQDGMRFMAAGALLKNGDATQAIDLNKIIDAGTNPDKGTMTQEAKDARSSLDYMMKDGGAAFASTVPHLMNIPAATYMTAGSSKLMGYKPVTISQGASEVIAGNDSTARDQMFNSFKELNTNENLFGERKQDHMNTFAQEIDKSFSKGGATVKYAGKEYKSAEELKTALGYDRWSGKSDQPTDTPDPGTYRDDDGNTRQSGGPGSGGVILG